MLPICVHSTYAHASADVRSTYLAGWLVVGRRVEEGTCCLCYMCCVSSNLTGVYAFCGRGLPGCGGRGDNRHRMPFPSKTCQLVSGKSQEATMFADGALFSVFSTVLASPPPLSARDWHVAPISICGTAFVNGCGAVGGFFDLQNRRKRKYTDILQLTMHLHHPAQHSTFAWVAHLCVLKKV